MAQSKRRRTRSPAPAGQAKRPRRTKNAVATGHDSKQRRSGKTPSTQKQRRGGAPLPQDQSTPRRSPSPPYPAGSTVESAGKERRGGSSDDNSDEETGAGSRQPGGTGDALFGSDDEGMEGPVR